MVPSHDILAHVGDFEHLLELFSVTSNEIQEGQTVKVLGALVTHLHNLMVTLAQSFAAQFAPNLARGI